MAAINYDSELKSAGAHATHGWRRLAFLAQRYVLGTFGLIIMILFVLGTALSADLIARYDPLTGGFRAPPRLSQLGALARHQLLRPRRLGPHHPRRANFARRRHRLDGAWHHPSA